MTDDEIISRIEAGEDSRTQFKREAIGVNDLAADELPVEKTSVRDLDLVHLGEYLEKNYAISSDDVRDGRADLPQLLQNLGFMDGSLLTLAGVMLFAKNPQRFCPVNVVKAVAFYGNDSSSSRFRDTADIAGSLRDMFNGTMRFLKENLRHHQVGTEFNQLGELDVSEEALKEVVANMFLHRDYFVASPWRVMIFDDRVELISPGSLPNHLTVEKIKVGVSVPRNPVLFSHATKEIPYRGIGTGIKRALELQKDIAFENDEDGFFFKVTFKRLGAHKKVDIGDERVDIEPERVDIGAKRVDIGTKRVDIARWQRVELLKRKFPAGEAFRRADVVRLLGLKPAMASRFIAKLVSLKLIVPVSGKGKGAYRVFGGVAR